MTEQYDLRYQAMIGLENHHGFFDAHVFDTNRREAILISTCCRDHNEALDQSIIIAKEWNRKYTMDLAVEKTIEKARSIKIRQIFNLKQWF